MNEREQKNFAEAAHALTHCYAALASFIAQLEAVLIRDGLMEKK